MLPILGERGQGEIELIEMFPSAILIVIAPARPTNWSVPESGTTVTLICGVPRVIVALCWSTKLPLRPCSIPLTRSIAT